MHSMAKTELPASENGVKECPEWLLRFLFFSFPTTSSPQSVSFLASCLCALFSFFSVGSVPYLWWIITETVPEWDQVPVERVGTVEQRASSPSLPSPLVRFPALEIWRPYIKSISKERGGGIPLSRLPKNGTTPFSRLANVKTDILSRRNVFPKLLNGLLK